MTIIYKLVAIVVLALIFVGLVNIPRPTQTKSLTPLSVAFDWTPNTNHTGIYVALQKGWYRDEGIELTLLPYSSTVYPDVLVAEGKADVGISSTEGVVADAAAGNPVVSIAAIISHNTSALAVRKDSGITKPAQLTNKIYGGFGAPFEEAVVRKMIEQDGGAGVFKNVILDVGAMEALKAGRIDFVWIFLGWDGILAKREGLELTTFPVTSFGIPDYATPNIITSPKTLQEKKEVLKKFMKATARGYEYARTNATESAKILIETVPADTFTDKDFV